MKISVIVPVYNASGTIRKLLNSLCAQTYSDFEAILVDDGSSDNSLALCSEYAKKDSRFSVFHKENGGVSSARNLGLENASGEWIAFADADDVLEPDYLKNLREPVAAASDIDFVMGGV